MEGIISNFRSSRTRQHNNQMIIVIDSITTKEKAQSLVGKTAVWTSPAKREIKGSISSAHGNKGAVRAIFEKGMPGQSVGSKVKIE